jgi:ubiquinone/menaquinone biosynthesis C-methylase UbiE
MLEQAAKRNARAIQRGVVELMLGSAESLPFEDETFDKVLAVNSFQVWANPASGLHEIWRVLKPGAKTALGFTVHLGQPSKGITDEFLNTDFTGVNLVKRDGSVRSVVGIKGGVVSGC